MFHRKIALFVLAVGVLVFSGADSSAQFGGKGKGGGKGPPRQDAEIERLREQIKELEAKLAKSHAGDAKKDEKGPPPFAGGFGKGPGGFGKGPGGFGPGGFGPGKPFPGAPANFDPEKMKKVLQLYELLYGDDKKDTEKAPGKKEDFRKEFGPPFGKKGPTPPTAPGSVEARIDRLIGELEQLRRELKKK
jgi:hypothetical protein